MAEVRGTVGSAIEVKTIQNIGVDLAAIDRILLSFKDELNRLQGQPQALLTDLEASLTNVQLAIRACTDACETFKAKTMAAASDSTQDHTTVSMNLAAKKVDAVRKMDSEIEKSFGTMNGQIQGLRIGIAAIENSDTQSGNDIKDRAAEIKNLNNCVKVCVAAIEEATEVAGNTVKIIDIRDRARVVAGVSAHIEAGGAEYGVVKITARDDARAWVGVVAAEDALKFLTS
ncbi:hypothetical protein Dda_6818 [Drechslerella dactyloides]|uniref:Fungal N-terminal domain-containing protein n=1 Tax=Drechslerella dactyloides TaxID=74499 RepID=A0AAD6IWB0_DREDA|nr:hypothetical protein Dda_6818 [Drechslerella dactyloides]